LSNSSDQSFSKSLYNKKGYWKGLYNIFKRMSPNLIDLHYNVGIYIDIKANTNF